ncbi:MAG: ATP-binding cassette domain-containing protein [Clostridiales bacterium]|nr:ATP-binding cassette domain-containing protein [Clostridiales bacterium]
MESVLTIQNVVKKYGSKTVLSGVNMNIKKGDIYGFVGENGSGKTTVIRLITGLIRANGGEFSLFGADSRSPEIYAARKKVGAIVETPSIYLNMSAKDNLLMQSELVGKKDEEKCKKVLEQVGLLDLYSEKKQAGNFSLGMRQRLGIAMALLGEPEFIILDEPMNGLDPAGIVEIRELILKLNRENGITFLISSHILTELELVATTYGIISKGKIVREITAEQLKNECRHYLEIFTDEPEKVKELLGKKVKENDLMIIGGAVRVFGEVDLNEVLGDIIGENIKLNKVNTVQSSIEEYYLSILGGAKNA